MKSLTSAILLLITAVPTFASPYQSLTRLAVRQSSQACASLSINAGKGGRKIAIVVDTSGSNLDTDPSNLRFVAGKALNAALITSATAGSDRKADSVAVIDFDALASVIYPLGDPSGAGPAFDKLDSNGGTSIYLGVRAAITELSKAGTGPTKDISGIVVLTDGQDTSISSLSQELERAGNAGIRVSFGYLDNSISSQPASVTAAILRTGGIYTGISDAKGQEAFVSLVYGHGLTNSDSASSNSTILLSGLNRAAFVDTTGPNKFTYAAQAGEKLNFTLASVSAGALDVTLRDSTTGTDLTSTTSDTKGRAVLLYEAPIQTTLELSVTGSNKTSDALFTVFTTSSLGISNCSLPITNGTTPLPPSPTATNPPFGNGTIPPTATPPPYTGSAAHVLSLGGAWGGTVGKVYFAGILAALVYVPSLI